MTTTEEDHPGVEPTNEPETTPPAVTAQAIPKSTSPPPATAMPAHATSASPTSTTGPAATATPIQAISPSPGADAAPARTQPVEVPIPPPQEAFQDMPNPRLASLSAIFPDFDSGLLESVLDSVDGNEERAADILLGMSDPNYISQVEPTERQGPMSQTELDEQLAQRLMLEEQQHSDSRRSGTRERQATNRSQNAPGNPDQGDTMDKFFDSVDKFAETSKKTLTGLFQKVKAKVEEFDSNRSGSSANQGGRPPQQQPQQQQWQGQSQTYYQPPAEPQAAPAAPAGETWQGYDLSSPSPPAPRPSEPDLRPPQQRATPSTTPPPSNIDPSKIGMLPKRPVSLLGPQTPPPAQSPTRRDSDGEGDLDYVENPFEEGRHR